MSASEYIQPTLKDLLSLEHLAFSGALLPNRLVHNVLAGKHASKLRGRGLDFAEVRKYVPGDDIRTIDWKVTARTKTTHTKVFEEEKERPVFVLTDLTSSMFFGSMAYTKAVLAMQLAAITGFRTLKVTDRFGGILFGDEDETFIKPQRSRVALLRFLENAIERNDELLKRTELSPNTDRLNKMLKRTAMTITHDHVVVIITDMNGANQKTFDSLIKLSMHNDVILASISDPLEKSTPKAKMLVGDGNAQILIKGNVDSLSSKLNAHQLGLKEILESKLRRYNIVTLDLSTERNAIEQLKEVFAKAVK